MTIWKNLLTWTFSVWKSTLLKELEKRNIPVLQELSRNELNYIQKTSNQLDDLDLEYFQKLLLYKQLLSEKNKQHFITDCGIIENLAYSSSNKKVFDYIYNNSKDFLLNNRYKNVFYIPPQLELENDWIRYIDKSFQLHIDNKLKELYSHFWYNIINLESPKELSKEKSIEYRLNIVLNTLNIKL